MERLKLETIENIIKTHKTVVEVLENEDIDDDYDLSLDKCIIRGMEELKQYRIAEEQGKLIILPCKVGDTIYLVDFEEEVMDEATVEEIIIDSDGIFFNTDYECYVSNECKYLFLTKEEAEQALAKMKEV